jgi:hypothetical protein
LNNINPPYLKGGSHKREKLGMERQSKTIHEWMTKWEQLVTEEEKLGREEARHLAQIALIDLDLIFGDIEFEELRKNTW